MLALLQANWHSAVAAAAAAASGSSGSISDVAVSLQCAQPTCSIAWQLGISSQQVLHVSSCKLRYWRCRVSA
jgi:hypothetical protein